MGYSKPANHRRKAREYRQAVRTSKLGQYLDPLSLASPKRLPSHIDPLEATFDEQHRPGPPPKYLPPKDLSGLTIRYGF